MDVSACGCGVCGDCWFRVWFLSYWHGHCGCVRCACTQRQTCAPPAATFCIAAPRAPQKDMSRLPVPVPTAAPTAAPIAASDGRAPRWWEKKDCLACVRNRRPTATSRRQDAPPTAEQGVAASSRALPSAGTARPVEGVRVCDAPRAGQNVRPAQGVRASSVSQETNSARPAERAPASSRWASRTVPVARPVEGGRMLPGTPVATVEAEWRVGGSRGDSIRHARHQHLYGNDPYYYDHDSYYRRRRYGRDDGTALLGGLLFAELFLF